MTRSNKELIALNLLTYPTSKEAAEKSGVSITTIYRLKKDKDFQEILQKVKNSIFQETMQKAQGYCLESLEVLREVAQQILHGFRLQGLFSNLESAYMRMKTSFKDWMKWKEG